MDQGTRGLMEALVLGDPKTKVPLSLFVSGSKGSRKANPGKFVKELARIALTNEGEYVPLNFEGFAGYSVRTASGGQLKLKHIESGRSVRIPLKGAEPAVAKLLVKVADGKPAF